jgi:hypothetical protein
LQGRPLISQYWKALPPFTCRHAALRTPKTRTCAVDPIQASSNAVSERLLAALEEDGIAVISDMIPPTTLASMQRTFATRLRRLKWNNSEGYEKTSRYRHMVEDILMLDQGFLDVALHPGVLGALNQYLGESYVLAEAKGWLSLPTRRDFHGWHGDAWYDQSAIPDLQREIKLAFYLTDVSSGAFTYIKGTQGQIHPRAVSDAEIGQYPQSDIVAVTGAAGTGILFDTTGIHRQGFPILEPRRAAFYCYHDPAVPLQPEDIAYNRYHPLALNAAFLGDLTHEHRRVLGFGDRTNHIPGYDRGPRHPLLHSTMSSLVDTRLAVDEFRSRVRARLKRVSNRR